MNSKILLAVALVFGLAAQAEAVLLSDLINTNGSITSGDFTFDHFSFSGANAGDTAAGIIISTVLDGLTISGVPNLNAGFGDTVTYGYQVHIGNGETFNIATMNLSLAGVTGGGKFENTLSGLSLVPSETLLANATVLAGNSLAVTQTGNGNFTDLFVTNTAIWTGPLAASDLIPVIQETFSYEGTASTVPEPSTWLLLSSGLAGLVFWRRYAYAPSNF